MDCLTSVKYIIIHCSASYENRSYTVEQMERDHKGRGFKGIGYHFYIRRDGTRTQHRMLGEVGAHCKPYNHCSIGICYEGGLRADGTPADTRTPEQKAEMQQLVHMLRQMFPSAVVRGHRDMPYAQAKDCPCFDVRDEDFP